VIRSSKSIIWGMSYSGRYFILRLRAVIEQQRTLTKKGEYTMSIAIEDSKRTAIACKLADIKEMQNLLIANEEKLMSSCSDQEIRDRLGHMLEE
jgi:hypothetical protein